MKRSTTVAYLGTDGRGDHSLLDDALDEASAKGDCPLFLSAYLYNTAQEWSRDSNYAFMQHVIKNNMKVHVFQKAIASAFNCSQAQSETRWRQLKQNTRHAGVVWEVNLLLGAGYTYSRGRGGIRTVFEPGGTQAGGKGGNTRPPRDRLVSTRPLKYKAGRALRCTRRPRPKDNPAHHLPSDKLLKRIGSNPKWDDLDNAPAKPKAAKSGYHHGKRAHKSSRADRDSREMIEPDGTGEQLYARVATKYNSSVGGCNRLLLSCEDGVNRTGVLRGRMRMHVGKKDAAGGAALTACGDVVLVATRAFGSSANVDIIHKYTDAEVAELAEHVKVAKVAWDDKLREWMKEEGDCEDGVISRDGGRWRDPRRGERARRRERARLRAQKTRQTT